ncbi:MAG: hypothetical protein JSU65_13120, partial [Candidatus Zixiibacteriota bacterium]
MYQLFLSGDYNFVYVALVSDVNDAAYDRLDGDYNIGAFPTTFYDGGYQLNVGGSISTSVYAGRIALSGQRTVPPLDLITEVDWIGPYVIEITVMIGNNVVLNEGPAIPPAPLGDSIVSNGISTDFKVLTVDPEGDDLYYQFDWGDSTTSDWLGPFLAGDTCQMSHSWPDLGSYEVRVRARDYYQGETDWSSPLTVEVDCCRGYTGNVDADPIQMVDIGDLTGLI